MAAITDLVRTPIDLVVLTLDFCTLTFGQGACTATGEPCYNTYGTCKDKEHYDRGTREYKLVTRDAPLPWGTGERPYLVEIDILATEITDSLTVKARVTAVFDDEADTDVGIDPYVGDRSSVQGTFWKKLLARNSGALKGRPFEHYRGVYGEAEGSFIKKFVGTIDKLEIPRPGMTRIQAVDLLMALKDIDIAPAIEAELVTDISASITQFTLTDSSDLDAPPACLRIDDEVLYYTAVNTTTHVVSGVTRGYLGTTAAQHSANTRVQKVRHYAGNPFDILKTQMLETDAGYAAGYIDADAFADVKGWPGGEIDFEAYIVETTPLADLFWEIVDLLDCRAWVGEELKITICRGGVANRPDRTYRVWTDAENFIHAERAVDLNAGWRVNEVQVLWDKDLLADIDDVSAYHREDRAVDLEAQGANMDNEVRAKTLYCRWVSAGQASEETLEDFMAALAQRYLRHRREEAPIVSVALDLKDSAVKTGEYAKVTTDAIQNVDGTGLSDEVFQVVSRAVRNRRCKMALKRMPQKRIAIFAPAGHPDYADATAAEREYGFFADADGELPDGTPPYVWW
jgi:hypothetical protein